MDVSASAYASHKADERRLSFDARVPVYPEGISTCRAQRRQLHVFKRKCDISCQSGDPGKSRLGLPAEYTLVRDHHQTKRVSHTHTIVYYVYVHGIDRAHVHGTYGSTYDSCIRTP